MVGGNFDIPVMYQDLASYTINPVPVPFGAMTPYGYGNTGNVNIKPQLDNDKVELMNKKSDEGLSTAKKVGIGLAVVFAMGFIPQLFGKKSLQSRIIDLYKKHSPAVKTFAQNTWTKIKGQQNKWGRFKTYCSDKWDAFKNLFSREKVTP